MSTGKRSKDDGKTKMYKVVKEDTKRKKTKTKPKTKEDYVKESEVNKNLNFKIRIGGNVYARQY